MLWGCFGCLISREMSLKFCLKLDKRSLSEKMNQVWWMGKDGMRRKGRGFWFLQFNIVEVIIFNINTFTLPVFKRNNSWLRKWSRFREVEIGGLTNFKTTNDFGANNATKRGFVPTNGFSYFAGSNSSRGPKTTKLPQLTANETL